MTTEKFLVTDHVPAEFLKGFEELGFEVDYLPVLSHEDLESRIGRYTGIVISTHLILHKNYLDQAVKLKYILRPGSGLDNVDVEYAESKGILVFNSPEANREAVGEHAVGLLLGLLNNIPRAVQEVKEKKWIREPNKGLEIKGKTIGIIGYGNTGSAFAKKMSGFEAELLVYDKYKTGINDSWVKVVEQEELLEKADIISLHIPLTAETKHVINTDFIARCGKPFFLINTARGKLVKQTDLLDGLKTGKVRGAALDVLENEKLQTFTAQEMNIFEELQGKYNVIITPHIAGWTMEAREKIFFVVLEKFKAFLSKQSEV